MYPELLRTMCAKPLLSYIKSGREEGAHLITGGTVPEESALRNSYFLKPTIFTDVTADMKIGCEEIFGPVLTVFKFKSVEEVVRMANDTQFGLTPACGRTT